ncbi:MAG: helix-turn-helix domain-containing protein [Nitrospiraceae bacterium]|nr:helix-turn-helix domain-containing protein [Nitrospiraceae bacterium]
MNVQHQEEDMEEGKYQKLLTVREVAEVLGVSQVTIRTWDRMGKIRTIRTPGNHRRIPEGELNRLLNPTEEEATV